MIKKTAKAINQHKKMAMGGKKLVAKKIKKGKK